MASCTICGKGKMAGRNIRHKHSGLWERKAPATPRVFLPNIQKRALITAEGSIRINACTKCLKRIRKEPGWRGFRMPLFIKSKDQVIN
ncbi:50S ribosomal protein L28 [Candidatus Roizmanbacteria bacterium]|nr:50S ribosomal protein L28 [Candidatus Roizmanbacteria bacterium]